MKMLWKLTKEATRYKSLYVMAILSTLGLTVVNLAHKAAWHLVGDLQSRMYDKLQSLDANALKI